MTFDKLINSLPAIGTTVLLVLSLFVVHRFVLRGHEVMAGKRFRNQLIMILLTLLVLVVVIVILPMDYTLKGQLLSLFGILLTAAVALSSTTLLGNAMAGLMLRAVQAFRMGEFIETAGHFGRVSDMGLFHTEIQTEDRDLMTLPNLFLVTNPVKRIRPSGTILSAQVSLGYEVPHGKVERLLLEAATKSGLEEPFVRVIDLGNHSVSYKVAGLLKEVRELLAVRSGLRGAMLDSLHAAGVEIVSPEFRNNRAVADNVRIIPPVEEAVPVEEKATTEARVFDKAEEAASLEMLRTAYENLEKRLAEEGIDTESRKQIELKRERMKELIARKEAAAAARD